MAAPKETRYELKTPVTFGGEEITEVTIARKLKFLRGQTIRAGAGAGGDVKVDIDLGAQMDLACKMIGQVPAFLEELDQEDLGVIMEAALDFLFSALGTGPKQ